jgi:hypothetical protein
VIFAVNYHERSPVFTYHARTLFHAATALVPCTDRDPRSHCSSTTHGPCTTQPLLQYHARTAFKYNAALSRGLGVCWSCNSR